MSVLLLSVVGLSCHPKNKLIGTWQLIKKSNEHNVVFEFNPRTDTTKYIYWFKDDSTLITKDDNGSNRKVNKYSVSNDKINLFDSLHANTFYFKLADRRLSLKSIYSPFTLELKKIE